VKTTPDKSIFNGGDNVIAGLELEQKNGYVRVVTSPMDGFFSKVRLGKNDCIWSIDGVSVNDVEQIRHALKEASGKIVFVLTYNSFRKLKTTVMANVSVQSGSDKWKLMMAEAGEADNQPGRLEDIYNVNEKVRRVIVVG
jgi:C-terminal processing protease CtpA/Prc